MGAAPPNEPAATPPKAEHASGKAKRFWPLVLGSIGVVYGDIGTSPLYAFREALAQTAHHGVTRSSVLGVVSLAIWALILVVTVKYVFFLMRLSNRGEGGVLSLMALAQRAAGKRTWIIFALVVCGAALFYGDAIITPAISVLSAVEGLKTVPGIGPHVTPTMIMITTVAIIGGLFAIQAKGTGKVSSWFGPICFVWFLVLAALGLYHLIREPGVLVALSPTYAASFLFTHGTVGFFVLGSVFLTVTGAEALYADMGHFGRKPISTAWLYLVLPCLALNYLGQGAFALQAIDAAGGGKVANADWFFTMAPEVLRAPIVILATMATVIASQAVITGAYSLTSQAIQLGLLPRMIVRQTSEHEAGQIFLPQVSTLLLIGVIFLVAVFKTSSGLSHAYGLAVTGTMVITTSLAFVVVRGLLRWPLWKALLVIAPLFAIDLIFLSANALKLLSGGFVPLLLGGGVFIVMATWTRGSNLVTAKIAKESTSLTDVVDMLKARAPHRVAGTAIFFTGEADYAPGALMHNLKHNRVLHEKNIILTVRTASEPRIKDSERLQIDRLSDDFVRVTATWGFMETPNVPRALTAAKSQGLKFDVMTTSFFLGRRTILPAEKSAMPGWQDALFILLAKNGTSPTDFFHLPPGRVVEMGTQVSV